MSQRSMIRNISLKACPIGLMIFTVCLSATAVSTAETLPPPSILGSGLFNPVDISPAVVPHFDSPSSPPSSLSSPLFPAFPTTYDPVLTGRCPVDFSLLSPVLDRTATDCFQNFASIVGVNVCCPQFASLIHVLRALSTSLSLAGPAARDCFADVLTVLSSRQANTSIILATCSVGPASLTAGSCPLTRPTVFEKTVDVRGLIETCAAVDPLKECCRPTCHAAVEKAAFRIARVGGRAAISPRVLRDCEGVVWSWIAGNFSLDSANTAFRVLSSCRVNRVCPLNLADPSGVVSACRNASVPGRHCCAAMETYMASVQRQMLVTNKQAIICAVELGSMLRRGGVTSNVYKHCYVDIKDFSVQRCLLRIPPTDLIFDRTTGLSFTCDVADGTVSPWLSGPSFSPLSFCASEMSLPALPTTGVVEGGGGNECGSVLLVTVMMFLYLLDQF